MKTQSMLIGGLAILLGSVVATPIMAQEKKAEAKKAEEKKSGKGQSGKGSGRYRAFGHGKELHDRGYEGR